MNTAFSKLKQQLTDSPDYAWSWHCNIAMSIFDELDTSHEQANKAGARVMRRLFGIDITEFVEWKAFPWA